MLRGIGDRARRLGELAAPTYGAGPRPPGPVAKRLAAPSIGRLRECRGEIAELAEQARAHEFDLLGSGRVHVVHGGRCAGVEGHRYEAGTPLAVDRAGRWLAGRLNAANVSHACSVWQLVDPGYVPIDWQLDFKSGYRWSESTWYRDIRFGHLPGVDIKVPWELARMQHLPQLAWAHALATAGEPGFARPESYGRELRNQILDFVATNPPRFGVNWACTMDVAIRAANWLVACDLLRALGAAFDADFERVFLAAIHDHGRHIVENLEWYSDSRGNHYLSDVVGLLFVAAYLPSGAETDAWLAFSLRELVGEAEFQFGADGANFEGSTCYHRLAAELVAYATALALSLEPDRLRAAGACDPSRFPRLAGPSGGEPPRPRVPIAGTALDLPESHWERMARMAEFTIDVTRPDGRAVQIGDNDSGRFLKLLQRVPEDPLDHRHLVAALNGIVGRTDFETASGGLESDVVSGLAFPRGAPPRQPARVHAAAGVRLGDAADWERWREADRSAPHRLERRFEAPGQSLGGGLELRGYPDFGLWLFRGRRLFLAVRCGPIGQNGNGGHSHNDQLSIELAIDGEDRVRDPGTYLYTPLPARRNEYRSVGSHFAPRVAGREPGRLDLGLFRLGDEARAETLYFGPQGFVGKHRGFGAEVFRRVAILEDAILVTDWSSLELVDGHSPPPFSPGYGLRR
jgi:hypothetical protein